MFLKSLEVENFKSFKGEAVIPSIVDLQQSRGQMGRGNPIVAMLSIRIRGTFSKGTACSKFKRFDI